MFENKVFFNVEESNAKSFGYVFSGFFFFLGVFYLYFKSTFLIWSFILSFIFLFLSLFFSKVLNIPNKIWLKFGSILHFIISPIIMLFIFIITFFPIGFLIKILKIDLINIKINKNSKTYWNQRKQKMESLKKLF
jgi:hypothetical protein